MKLVALPADGSLLDHLKRAEEILGHRFRDRAVLLRALTHPSRTDESGGEGYERLEFLGDAVLGFLVVEELYRRFPDLPEGELTKMKVGLVSGRSLTAAAREIGLDDLVLLGAGEMATEGRGLESTLEDCFEAIVGAIHEDSGLEAARAFVARVLGRKMSPAALASLEEHPKSELQEYLQSNGKAPAYRITDEIGPVHDRTFVAEVRVEDLILGQGVGRSKKEAEADAAAQALDRLGLR